MTCPSLATIEALHDGRLVGPERLAAQAHAAMCATCAAHARGMEALGAKLAALPVATLDAPEISRRKRALIAALETRRRARRVAFGGGLGVLALAGAAVAAMMARAPAPMAARASGMPVVSAAPTASAPMPVASAASVASASTPGASAASVASATSVASAASVASASTPGASKPAASTTPATASPARPRARATALDGTAPDRAALDELREDAAYLDLIDRVRAGDRAAIRASAQRYLAEHPRGFRRPEVERVLNDYGAED